MNVSNFIHDFFLCSVSLSLVRGVCFFLFSSSSLGYKIRSKSAWETVVLRAKKVCALLQGVRRPRRGLLAFFWGISLGRFAVARPAWMWWSLLLGMQAAASGNFYGRAATSSTQNFISFSIDFSVGSFAWLRVRSCEKRILTWSGLVVLLLLIIGWRSPWVRMRTCGPTQSD